MSDNSNSDGGGGLAQPLPNGWIDSVVDFHRLAYSVVAEARRVATTRFALRSVCGGFGTAAFPASEPGKERCVCVVGDQLCVCECDAGSSEADCCASADGLEGCDAEGCTSQQITTLRAAAEFLGLEAPGIAAREHDSPELGDIDSPLAVSQQVGEILGWWYELGAAALTKLESEPGADEPEGVNLWPGHFDIANALGKPDSQRATYGFSPGDHNHAEPYVYVGSWGEVDRSDNYWNDAHFAGASLPYAQLLGVSDPAEMVYEFLLTGLNKLTS